MNWRSALTGAAMALTTLGTGSAVAFDGAAFPVTEKGPAALFDCVAGKTTLIAAHRGGPARGYPENAIETMEQTLQYGPMLMEVDVVTSRDGVLYLMHDSTLDRTTTGTGPVNALDWDEISELFLKDNAGNVTGFHPPRLSDVLEWARGKTILELDIKRGTQIEDVLDAVQDAEAEDHVILIVYDAKMASRAQAAGGDIMVSINVPEPDDMQVFQRAGIDMDRVLAWTGTRALRPAHIMALDDAGIPSAFGTLWAIDKGIAQGQRAHVYTAIARLGVDLIATDYPAEAYRAVQAAGPTPAALAQCR